MYRMITVAGKAALEHEGQYFDLATLTAQPQWGDPMYAVTHHDELHEWAAICGDTTPTGSLADVTLGPPVPSSRQVFGIGLNYRDHAHETGAQLPPAPLTFTKYPSCIAGPTASIPLSGETVDWEVELVAVVGRTARHVSRESAWDYLAGLTLGQDISDRTVQRAGVPPQFNLGKSFENYGPTGPALVSLDSFPNLLDIGLGCDVDGTTMQSASSAQMIFDIPTLVAYLSSIVTLYPGDLIFTGTPAGVGAARGIFLRPGSVLTSRADIIGSLRNECVAGQAPLDVSA